MSENDFLTVATKFLFCMIFTDRYLLLMAFLVNSRHSLESEPQLSLFEILIQPILVLTLQQRFVTSL